MSAGPGTQAEPIQWNQSAKGPDASQHSALFYLFQEVSKLASPIHSSPVGSDSPGRWGDASPQGSLHAEDTCCREGSDHSGSPQEAPHHGTRVKASRPGPVGHSPWKVLSLINLQCQRLLHHSDEEEPRSRDGLSQAAAPCAPTDGAIGGVGSDPQLHREDKNEEESSRNGACERSGQDAGRLPRHTTKATSGGLLHPPLAHGSNTQAVLFLRKPELTLDHNANLRLPIEAIRDPCSQSARLPPPPPSPATAPQCTSTQEGHPPVEHGGSHQGVTATKPPRKQPHPRRSVDIHDPALQGVMFRMDPELDHSRDRCRLLITSEFR